MKQLMCVLLLSILMATGIVFLSSCGHFHDEPTVSVWAGGGWVVFWLPFLGGLWFLYLSIRSQRSGTWKIIDNATTNQDGGKQKLTKFGKFIFAVALLAVSAFVIWYFNSPNWK